MSTGYKALSNRVKSQANMIRANEKSLQLARLNTQCICAHRDLAGNIDLIGPNPNNQNNKKSPVTGNYYFTCRSCGEQIDVTGVTEKEYEVLSETYMRVINLIKLHLNLKDGEDQGTLKRLATTEFEFRTLVRDGYRAIRKNDNGRKKKKKGNNPFFDIDVRN